MLLKNVRPNLILLDLMLLGLSGEELLPQLFCIPVIVVSAKAAVQDKVSLLLGGAADYLTKPFDTKELHFEPVCLNDIPEQSLTGFYGTLSECEQREKERESFTSAIRRFMRMDRLTAPLLRELIDRIDVFETEGKGKNRTQRFVIYYRFVGYVEIPEVSHRPNIVADTRKGVAVEYLTEPKTA